MDNSQFAQAPPPIAGQQVQTPTAKQPAADPRIALAKLQLQAQVTVGARWFYWIAGLSLINTISALSGSHWRFILGLGVTQAVDVVAANLSGPGKTAALVVDAFIAGLFVLLGTFAAKRQSWAFIVGMALFGLDTGISVLFKDWIGLAFHGYALYCIYRGYSKLQVLQKLK